MRDNIVIRFVRYPTMPYDAHTAMVFPLISAFLFWPLLLL